MLSPVANRFSEMQGTPFYEEQILKLKEYFKILGYSETTIKSYIKNLTYFFNWLKREGESDVDQRKITDYLKYLQKRPISSKTIQTKYNILKHYDEYIYNTTGEKVLTKPLELEDTDVPKSTEILTPQEIKRLYGVTEETILGLRDRAFLSLYYGCGLRNLEGTRVEIDDIDYRRGILDVKPSKNYQNRHIPLSIQVILDLERYEKHSRPHLMYKPTNAFLLNNRGTPLSPKTSRTIFKKLISQTEIKKKVTLHSLRHSLGTHLLNEGMDLEQIGQLLGHKSLDTTQLYAQININ